MEAAGNSKLERLRHRAKTDLLWLATEVLGYDFQENPHRGMFAGFLKKGICQCGHLHSPAEICAERDDKTGLRCGCSNYSPLPLMELDPVTKRRMILWQRGAFKTSAAAVEMVQLILNYPDIRIMILAGDLKESSVRLEEVKSHFENWGKDDKLHTLFPEFCSPVKGRKLGNSKKFISPARTKKLLRQPTLAVASPKVLKTGTHFDVIVVDDLVNELNCKTAEQLQKSIKDYKSVVPVLEPEGYIYVLGTRYSFDDAYGWIQRQIEEQKLPNWNVSIRTCWITRCRHCDHADIRHMDGGGKCGVGDCECEGFESNGVREVLFPQTRTREGKTIGFTVETLEKLKKELGPEDFGCQYENNPLAGGQQKFTKEILYSLQVPPWKIPRRGPIVIQVDTAISQNKRADDMVIFVSRLWGGRHHIIDCVGGKIPPESQAPVICDLILKYGPRAVFIEKKAGAQYLEQLIVIEAKARGIQHLPLELITAENTPEAKLVRIDALLGYIMAGRLAFMLGLPNWDKIEQQLLLHPKSQLHDDFADCLARLFQSPTGFETMQAPPEPLPFWLRETKQETQEPTVRDSPLPFGLNG